MEDTVSKGFATSERGRHLLDMFETNAPNLEPEAIVKMLQARAPVDLLPILPDIRKPLLVVNGEFDSAVNEGRRVASLVPGAEHHMLPGAGHACCLEDPAAFNARAMAFLSKYGLLPEP